LSPTQTRACLGTGFQKSSLKMSFFS
jgi:hypothetical protein